MLALLAFVVVIKLTLLVREWMIRAIDRRLQVRHRVIGRRRQPAHARDRRECYVSCARLDGDRLGAYLRGRLAEAVVAVVRASPNILGIIAVIVMTRTISLWVSRVIAEVEHGTRTVTWLGQGQARATRRIASGLICVLGLAVAYSLLPWSNNPIFQGMSIVIGLGASDLSVLYHLHIRLVNAEYRPRCVRS